MEYIAVEEAGGEAVEVELEEDLSITLATLTNEFGSGVAGLSYINPKTGLRRILRISTDGKRVNPPRHGWSSETTYTVTREKGCEDTVPVPQLQRASIDYVTRREAGVDVKSEQLQDMKSEQLQDAKSEQLQAVKSEQVVEKATTSSGLSLQLIQHS